MPLHISLFYPHQSQERGGYGVVPLQTRSPFNILVSTSGGESPRVFSHVRGENFQWPWKRGGRKSVGRLRRGTHGPVSAQHPVWAGRRLSQRGARRRRATIRLRNPGGSRTPWSETPGTLSSPRSLFLDHPRELQLGPYPPLGKCRAVSGVRWEWIRPSLEPLRLSRTAE